MSLHYKLLTGGGSDNIMFLHGFPLTGRSWSAQEALIDDFASILIPDLPGFGKSDASTSGLSMDLIADELFALMDSLGWKSCIWAGLSMGGYITLRAYERDPSRFDDMVLIDTKSASDTDAGRIGRSDAIRSLRMGGIEPFAEGFVKKVVGPNCDQHTIDGITSIILENEPIALERALIAMAARTDTTGTLNHCKVPVGFIVGEHDKLTPPDVMREMADITQSKQFHVIPGAGHLSAIENPQAFNAALLACVRSAKN
jgi:pimeloyl-ACP methyl ester carboxylesterase